MRATPRSDTGVSAAELVFGKTLRLPGDLFGSQSISVSDANECVRKIREVIEGLKPRPTIQRSARTIFIHSDLSTCSHVFVRVDLLRKSLQAPYEGPYQVIERSDKSFLLKMADKHVRVSIDRLKPAYLVDDGTFPQKQQEKVSTDDVPSNHITNSAASNKPVTYTTRSGRSVKRPIRFVT